jgi:glutaredoxin-like protein
MGILNEEVKKQLTSILSQLKSDVGIAYFTQEFECPTCRDTHVFLDELTALSPRLSLKTYEFRKDSARAKELGAERIPAIVLLDKDGKDSRIKFYGFPGGYEINSFLGAILEVSGIKESLPQALNARIAGIGKDTHIQVFVTLGCPYCPAAVMTAHRLALENPRIRDDMVEASTFTPLAIKYNVSSVPKIVINDRIELIGAQPIEAILDAIEKL